MSEQELIAAVRPAGRYEVISLGDGSFIVIPIPPKAILITPESHQQHTERFRKTGN